MAEEDCVHLVNVFCCFVVIFSIYCVLMGKIFGSGGPSYKYISRENDELKEIIIVEKQKYAALKTYFQT